MPRIAVVDLSFHWPPTGGSWVDIAQVCKGLGERGAQVRMFVPRLDTGGLSRGLINDEPPVEIELLPMTLRQFNPFQFPNLVAERVEKWNPEYVMVTNAFAMAPWIVDRLHGFKIVLRIYGYEMLCPYYMSLWPKGKVAHWVDVNPKADICGKDFLSSPNVCTRCALRGMGRELLPRWMNPFSHEYVASLAFLPHYHTAVKKAFRAAYRILVSNSFTAGKLTKWKEKVMVVPGGVDPMHFRPSKKPRESSKAPVILMSGRVDDPRKGYSIFREAIDRVAEAGLRFEALVTDPRYDGNSLHIESLGWVGVHRMPEIYRKARVVVTPTMWPEPFGLVALEAMACGVPVVAHNIGGFSGLVKDGETGFLVPPGEPSVLADRIATLLKDDDLWSTMSSNARKRALSFSWENTIQGHYLALFGMD